VIKKSDQHSPLQGCFATCTLVKYAETGERALKEEYTGRKLALSKWRGLGPARMIAGARLKSSTVPFAKQILESLTIRPPVQLNASFQEVL
jgi:hypothetical protein